MISLSTTPGAAPVRPGAALWGLLALTLLAYANSLLASFQFDDFNVIVDNPAVHSLRAWWDGAAGIRPLLKLSYTLNWVVSPAPFGFHLVNLVVHLINSVLVLQLLRVLPLPQRLQPYQHWIALAAALLFAVHPANTEAVTYVSGRSVSLMSSFYLGSVLAWIHGRRSARPALLAASCALFVLALLVKEVAISLPLTLLLLELAGACGARRRAVWLVPAALCLLALAVMWQHERYVSLLLTSLLARSGADQLAGQLAALAYLLSRLWLPHQLTIDPDVRLLAPAAVLPALALLLAWCALGCLTLRSRPWLALPLLLPLAVLLPTNSLLPRLDLVNERQLYLASPFLMWGLAQGLALLPRRRAVLILLTAVLLPLTLLRNADYRTEVSLWQSAAERAPHKARVFNNLGWAWLQQGHLAAAEASWRHALALDPGFERARINLQRLQQGR